MDLIGATYIRDVEPGEVLVISADGMRSIKPFPAGAARALRVRARLLRAPGQLRVRQERQRSAHESRTHPRPGAAGRRRRRRAGARLRRLRGDGLCGRDRASRCAWASSGITTSAARSSSRSPSIRHFGVKVKLNPVRSILEGRRVVLVDDSHRARDDEPEDRPDGASGGREGSARAHQLSADDLALLLRRRYAAAVGADCGHAHARRDSRFLDADSVGYLSLEGLMSAVGDGAQQLLQFVLHGPLSRSRSRATRRRYLQLALKLDKEPVTN